MFEPSVCIVFVIYSKVKVLGSNKSAMSPPLQSPLGHGERSTPIGRRATCLAAVKRDDPVFRADPAGL